MINNKTLEGCCKLMAKILSEKANEFEAGEIEYKLNNITDKNGKSYGSIKVIWTENS